MKPNAIRELSSKIATERAKNDEIFIVCNDQETLSKFAPVLEKTQTSVKILSDFGEFMKRAIEFSVKLVIVDLDIKNKLNQSIVPTIRSLKPDAEVMVLASEIPFETGRELAMNRVSLTLTKPIQTSQLMTYFDHFRRRSKRLQQRTKNRGSVSSARSP